ncbi:MAG: glycoside hydrolase family 31 protein [Capsulimonadaceae bacterium]|nr:glycoside hydrolase family 31 protein [Capsulimonadaceae bacterium]
MSQHRVIVRPLSIGGHVKIEIVAPHTFRLRYSPGVNFTEPSLIRYGIIRGEWPNTPFELHEAGSELTIVTTDATLAVNLLDGGVTLRNAAHERLTTSAKAPYCSPSDGFGADFAIEDDEKFYGLGDVTRDRLQMRGLRAEIWVRNVRSYVPNPFLMSDRGWGLFVNSTWRHVIDIASETLPQVDGKSVLHFGGRQGDLDFYLFAGENLPALLDRYTTLAGKPALLPKWAYGLTFVCNQQANAREMIDDCLSFRRAGIPCDTIGLEPGWMEKYYDYSTKKKWHPERFYIPPWIENGADGVPSPDTFISAARRLGFKLSLWLCSDYDLLYEEERRVAAETVAVPEIAAPPHPDDFERDDHFGHGPLRQDTLTDPEEGWFEHLKKFVDQGACAFKMDGANQVNEHPDRKWGYGLPRGPMDDDEMHNLYPILLNKQMSTGFSEHTGRRSMIYSSGGYVGIQQFAATWAGDTGGGQKPLVSLLNHGLSGHSNTSCDMNCYSATAIHFGFTMPWPQVCSWAYWRHPWLLGTELEAVFKFYARLRYRLMPYIYSMAHVANQTGMPIMRAIPLAFPEQPGGDEMMDHYMLGDAFLTAAFTNRLHVPAGEWVDFWTGEVITGPCEIDTPPPAYAGGPLLVRAGSIVPLGPLMNFTGEKPVDVIDLHIFGGSQGEFILWEDDGETLSYREGITARTKIAFSAASDAIDVTIGQPEADYDGVPRNRTYRVKIHAPKKPSTVTVNGNAAVDWAWHAPGEAWIEQAG